MPPTEASPAAASAPSAPAGATRRTGRQTVSTHAHPTGPALTDRIEPHIWRIAGVLILGMVMSVLDTTIVNVALDTLGRDLHNPISQVQWVVTGYLLSLAAVIPLTGWSARRFGARRVYLTSLVLFTAGSAACGLSSSLAPLVVFRVLQGAGGGMLMPVVMIMMAEIAGPKRMGRVMSIVAMPMMLAPIFGPVLGGIILENLHWSWIFFVNLPIGVLAFALAWRTVPRFDSGEAGPLDVIGVALLPTGAASIVFGLSELGSGARLGSLEVLLPVIAGVLLIAAFCRHALRAPQPLLDIRMYANRVFAGASLVTFVIGAALFGAMILVPLYYQVVRRETVIDTGLLNGPQGIGALVGMPLANRLTERIGGGRVTLAGVIMLCASTVPFAFIGANTSILAISLTLVARGVSIGLCFMPAMTAAYASLRPDQISHATPQINMLQRLGGALGTAILAVVLQRSSQGAHTPAAVARGFDSAYWWALGIAALSLAPALLLLRAERPQENGGEDRRAPGVAPGAAVGAAEV
ncbi:MAG: DHA2 family efflux MFS transporter permease subunit [Acidobacteriota bacterium]|nr:DHA2 family efflux MFS transporter permease subunit [Acidobacteriota bacterium]